MIIYFKDLMRRVTIFPEIKRNNREPQWGVIISYLITLKESGILELRNLVLIYISRWNKTEIRMSFN